MMLEKAHICDRLYMDHNVKLPDIEAAEKKFKLENDPELVAIKEEF